MACSAVEVADLVVSLDRMKRKEAVDSVLG